MLSAGEVQAEQRNEAIYPSNLSIFTRLKISTRDAKCRTAVLRQAAAYFSRQKKKRNERGRKKAEEGGSVEAELVDTSPSIVFFVAVLVLVVAVVVGDVDVVSRERKRARKIDFISAPERRRRHRAQKNRNNC